MLALQGKWPSGVRTDSIRVQKNEPNPTRNANPTQPNPYSSGWVGPSCRVAELNVHP